MHMGIDIIRMASGRTPAAAGVLGIERGAAGRFMAREGTGKAPAPVKEKTKGPSGCARGVLAYRRDAAARSAPAEGASMRASRTVSTGFALASLFLGGCSSVNYGSQVIEGGDVSKAKTFCALVAPQDKVPMDPAMREYLATRVVPAVTAEMKGKGYVEAPEASADVVVATHAFLGVADVSAIRWNATIVVWDPWGPWVGGFYNTTSVGKKGIVMIDVGDPKAQKLLFRGWASGTGELGAGKDPAKVRSLVGKVLSDLPKSKK